MFKKLLRKEEGFTMVEMMVVLIIVAVLIAGGIRFYLGYIENSRVTKAKAQITTMQASLDSYYAENGSYPFGADLATLTSEMLNAGLVVTGTPAAVVAPIVPTELAGTAGADGTLNLKDPWGTKDIEYYRYHSTDGTEYYIRTGENSVQGNTAAITAVFGNGSAGSSNSLPSIGLPTEP